MPMMPIEDVQFTAERWLQFWDNYKGLPHQKKAITKLGKHIKAADPGLLTKSSEWVVDWGSDGPADKSAAKLTPASPFSARISPNIRIGEFALDRQERRFTHQHQVDTAAELAAFLERVRSHFGKPVIITSGYRPASVNRAVGGASQSEHLYNAPGVGAVDFLIQGADIFAVQAWCNARWPYSLGFGAPKGFVHLGIRAGKPRLRWDY